MTLQEKVKLACQKLDEKKGEDIVIIDISEISTLGDYFVIVNGSSTPHVHSLVNEVDEVLGKQGIVPRQMEGYQKANWILMDYGDFVIHVFDKENRPYYDLERIWKDGKKLTIDEL